MFNPQLFRDYVNERLGAAAWEILGMFEKALADCQEELHSSRRENDRLQRQLLVSQPVIKLHRADIIQVKNGEDVEENTATVLQEEPEMEVCLAATMPVSTTKEFPVKRTRGRPPKTTSPPKPASPKPASPDKRGRASSRHTAAIIQVKNEEEELEENEATVVKEEEEPEMKVDPAATMPVPAIEPLPVKRKRGRPRKTTRPPKPASQDKTVRLRTSSRVTSAVFVKSMYGKQLLTHNGYTYRKERLRGIKSHWKCTEYDRYGCRGRAVLCNGVITYLKEEHTHPPDVMSIKKRETLQAIKEKCLETHATAQQVVVTALQLVAPAIQGALPAKNNMQRMVRRHKQKHNPAPPTTPTTLQQLIIPNSYQVLANGDQFLLYDSGPGPDRILLFSTEANLNYLSRSKNWFADGTFKTDPSLFYQLYSIHGLQESTLLPLVFMLLPNKTQETYERAFRALKGLCPSTAPDSVMMDFEAAAINATKAVFPGTEIRGCFFHLCQSFWRKIQQYPELLARYRTDTEFAHTVKSLPSLACVPPADVARRFGELVELPFFQDEQLAPLLEYFEYEYIGRKMGHIWSAPAFPIDMWNCYAAVESNLVKMNNAVEGWHCALALLLGATNPTIWKFIDALRSQQNVTDLQRVQFQDGHLPPHKKRRCRARQERLACVVNTYDRENFVLQEYLNGVAYSFDLQQ